MAFDLRNVFSEFREQRRLQERSAQVQELLGSAEGGTGLLADPSDVARQVEFAGGLEAIGPGQGSQFLSSILGDVAAGERQEMVTTAGQQNAMLQALVSRLNAQENIQQREVESVRAAQTQIGTTRMGLAAAEARAGAGDGFNIPGVEFGTVAPGMARIINPDTQTPIDVALPGSAPHVAAANILGTQQSMEDNIEQFLQLFDRVGTEFATPDAATLGTYRQRIISGVARLDQMGVLQTGELERIESTLPDPTSLGRQVQSVVGGVPVLRAITGSNASMRQGYQTLLEQIQFQSQLAQETYKFWPGLEGFLPAPPPPNTVPAN